MKQRTRRRFLAGRHDWRGDLSWFFFWERRIREIDAMLVSVRSRYELHVPQD